MGYQHSCARFDDGTIRCWGVGTFGRLGNQSSADIGDDERPVEVHLGGKARDVAAGHAHTCALMTSGKVRCWGRNDHGQLGYGHRRDIGDDEAPDTAGDVALAGAAVAISVLDNQSCALLESGDVQCWGENGHGELGYGGLDHVDRGDDETLATLPPIRFARSVRQLAYPCALFDDGGVVCWRPDPGDPDDVTTPATKRPDVPLGGPARRLGTDCFLMDGLPARCRAGQSVGAPGWAAVAPEIFAVPYPDVIKAISSAGDHGCMLRADGHVKCWGRAQYGILGVPGMTKNDDNRAVQVDVGATATTVAVANGRTCVITTLGGVRCWGLGQHGWLGYGTTENVGEQRAPAVVGDVSF